MDALSKVVKLCPVAAVAAMTAFLAVPCSALSAQQHSYSEGEKLFALKVKPLLKLKCFACHGAGEKIEGDLILTNREEMLQGGETSDDVLVPGNGTASLLYKSTTRKMDEYQMPPKEADRLTEDQTWLIRDWIDAGAPWPSEEDQAIILAKYAEGVVVQTSGGLDDDWTYRRYDQKNLWAYQPLADPAVPSKSKTSHPIDAFINRKLDRIGLTPGRSADRRTLIRRATFDLIGLPPRSEEVEAFLKDRNSDGQAFAKVVDRLLDDPRYGEQWGRHWLDVVRYADSAGFANDYERPAAWRYRDYVIRSFNKDKPFDYFILEQVAGDEWHPDDPEALIATGFLRMGSWENTSMTIARLTRQQFLDDVTDIVGQTFLSHPLQCARCHDHKFDPIPTKDYYRIQSVFATTQFVDRKIPFQDDETITGFDEKELMQTRLRYFTNIRDELSAKESVAVKEWCLEKGIPNKSRTQLARLGIPDEKLPPRGLGLTSQEIGIRKVGLKNLLRSTYEMNKFEPFALSVYSGVSPEVPLVSGKMVAMPDDPMSGGELDASYILTGGDPFSQGTEVTPGVFSTLPDSNESVEATDWNSIPATPTGRRLAFAKWLASPRNVLVPRSMTNRIWSYHFGQGIVDTPNNFGAMGGKPSHPELLDYLASRFIESGWSVKQLHRLIMSSTAYRRSTEYKDRERLEEKDPNANTYAAFHHRRLSAEELRDSMLYVSGELNPLVGGLPALPEINMDVALQPRQIMGSFAASYQPARTPEQRNRRSVYAKKARGLLNPMMEVFNQPSPEESCEARQNSTVTPQVFTLFNGQDSLCRSIATALDLLKKNESRKSVVEDLFLRAYGRRPNVAEHSLYLAHWDNMEKRHERLTFEPRSFPREVTRSAVEEMTGTSFEFTERLFGFDDYVSDPGLGDVDATTRALADVCLVVFNSNEFIYVY
ncbi:MAG: PSD1 and planctomycete cytochrome C domain-containing protein [Fuerstiella sp.]